MFHSSLKYLLFICTLLALHNCNSNPSDPVDPGNGTFRAEPVQSETHILNAREGVLLAGTTDGAYRTSHAGGNSWNRVGLEIDSAKVTDFAMWSNKEILAAVNYENPRTDRFKLYKTENSGRSWRGIDVEYDTTKLRFFRIQDLIIHPDKRNTLYANAGIIATSPDKGNTWKILRQRFFSQFLTLAESQPDILWTGGSTNIFSPFLAKSTDSGNTWSLLNNNIGTGSDGTVWDIVVHPENSRRVLAAMGGIRKTNDGGESWQTINAGNVSVSTFTHSFENSDGIYASGRNADGSLFFVASGDFGQSWETIEWEDSPAGVQVNDMVSVIEDGQEVLYFGTNKGVFSYWFEE